MTSRILQSAVPTAAMICLCLASAVAQADGDPRPTAQREAAMQRYKGCKWTEEMGKFIYECIKKNDGMNTHWCYDETLEVYCVPQLEAAKAAAGQSQKPAN